MNYIWYWIEVFIDFFLSVIKSWYISFVIVLWFLFIIVCVYKWSLNVFSFFKLNYGVILVYCICEKC